MVYAMCMPYKDQQVSQSNYSMCEIILGMDFFLSLCVFVLSKTFVNIFTAESPEQSLSTMYKKGI